MHLSPAHHPSSNPRFAPGAGWRRSATALLFSLASLVGLVSLDVAAQGADAPAYRCGNSYSSKPCPGGTAVDAADPRSAAQQREAREASQRQADLARQMKADRLATERATARGGAANLGPTAAKPPAKAASKPHANSHKKAHKVVKPAKPAQPSKAASAPR